MTILPFLVITFGAGAASILTRGSARLSMAIGILGLAAAAIAAGAIKPDETISIGGGDLVGSAYLRLFVLLGSVVALLLAVLGLATRSHREAPGVLLGGIGAAGLALAIPDARIAVIAATAGGLLGILVTVVPPATARGVVVAGRELRALAVAGVLAILAAAWIGRPLEEVAAEPAVFGLAYLGFATAVAIRFGAIPFHFWAARLADAAPEVTLPMLMAWGPAAFAVVALAWVDQSVAPLVLPLSVERALIVAIGAVSVVLGSLAALIQDDLEHVVGYTIISDAGVAILGLAALGPETWEPARTWVLVFVMVRSAFAAWAVAMRGAFGTRRIGELRGWLVRAPLLAIALGLIVVAAVGWPGLAAWQARATLIDLTLGGVLVIAVMIGALAQVAVYARLFWVGFGRPSDAVAHGTSERPRWPVPLPSRPMVGQSGMERGFERTNHFLSALLDVIWVVPAALRANRVLIAGLLVLSLSGLALGVAAGGFGVPEAAAAVPGQVSGPTGSEPPAEETEPPASVRPTESVPPPTAQPGASGSPSSSGSPSASVSPEASPSP
jgi:formate hydrogenlyase subunit 3/multisubunit Na+/H+ antiporter MnhD subunit